MGVLGLGMLLLGWRMGVDLGVLKQWWKAVEGFLILRPWVLFAALVVLPGFPVPSSALFFLAGTVWRDRPVMACALSLLAMLINMSWTYWLAARPGRGLVEKLLAASTVRVPQLPKGDDIRLILIVRLTPGIPLFFQNYLLGFFRVPFRWYLPLSVGCIGLVACGVVLSGAGVADGNLTPLVGGLGLIVVGLVVVQVVRKRCRVISDR
jgi:uncharacterized membrane protein YdjX (TVP38/TMEM64 family)